MKQARGIQRGGGRLTGRAFRLGGGAHTRGASRRGGLCRSPPLTRTKMDKRMIMRRRRRLIVGAAAYADVAMVLYIMSILMKRKSRITYGPMEERDMKRIDYPNSKFFIRYAKGTSMRLGTEPLATDLTDHQDDHIEDPVEAPPPEDDNVITSVNARHFSSNKSPAPKRAKGNDEDHLHSTIS